MTKHQGPVFKPAFKSEAEKQRWLDAHTRHPKDNKRPRRVVVTWHPVEIKPKNT